MTSPQISWQPQAANQPSPNPAPPVEHPCRRGWIIAIVATAVIALGLGASLTWRLMSDARANEPAVASAAKADSASTHAAPDCPDGQVTYNMAINGVSNVMGPDGPVATDVVSATGKYNPQTGLVGDITVASKAKDSKPNVKFSKVYTWSHTSDDKGKTGWFVVRYVTPEPVSLLLIKGSNLAGHDDLMACAIPQS